MSAGRTSSAAHPLYVYVVGLLVVFAMLAGAAIIWSATENSGTNVLSTDAHSTSPPAPLTAP